MDIQRGQKRYPNRSKDALKKIEKLEKGYNLNLISLLCYFRSSNSVTWVAYEYGYKSGIETGYDKIYKI